MVIKNVETIYSQQDYDLNLSIDLFSGLTSGSLYVLSDRDSDVGGAITLELDDMIKLRDALNEGIKHLEGVFKEL